MSEFDTEPPNNQNSQKMLNKQERGSKVENELQIVVIKDFSLPSSEVVSVEDDDEDRCQSSIETS